MVISKWYPPHPSHQCNYCWKNTSKFPYKNCEDGVFGSNLYFLLVIYSPPITTRPGLEQGYFSWRSTETPSSSVHRIEGICTDIYSQRTWRAIGCVYKVPPDLSRTEYWIHHLRHGPKCGQVVSSLASYSKDSRSNPAENLQFFRKIVVERNENKQKEAGVDPLKNVVCSAEHSI